MMKAIFLFFSLLSLNTLSSLSQSLNDSLIVHYPLDGNAVDIGPNNLNGSFFATAANDCAGNAGGATYFDGVDDYIELPNNILLQPQLPVSFSFRIKLVSYSGTKIFFTNDFDYTHYYGIYLTLSATGDMLSTYGDGGSQDISNRRTANGNTNLDLNKWYDITVVVNGPTSTDIYVNCSMASVTYVGTGDSLAYSPNNSNSYIGRFARPPSQITYFNGYLDEFRMWNRALTPQDVDLLHNSPCILTDTISTTICQGDSTSINNLDFHKHTGIYSDTIKNATALGCDSIVVLDLTVLPNSTTILNQSICSGENFNFNGQILSTAGVYSDTLTSANSCDSIVNLNLTVNPIKLTQLKRTICAGEIFIFQGKAITAGGNYKDTLLSSLFCDSIIELDLTVLPNVSTFFQVDLCDADTFHFNGKELTFSGLYTDTLVAANMCDSIISLQLNVLPRSFTPLKSDICQGDTLDFNGRKLANSGIYHDTLISANLCDSIVTLDLTVKPRIYTPLNVSICENGFYFFDGKSINSTGVYIDTLQASNLCDSIVTLNLTVLKEKDSTIFNSICIGDIYDFNGKSLTTAGSYIDTVVSSNLCDSIITLELSVLQSSQTTLSRQICTGEIFNFNGKTLNSAGTYLDTMTAANSCDSIITLNLTVLPLSLTTLKAQICEGDTVEFNGSKVFSSGTYTDTLTAANLCDSIITLELEVKPLGRTNIMDSIFSNGSFFFAGKYYTEAGIYRDTLLSSNACDSIITLYLSIKYPSDSINFSICPGDTVEVNGKKYFKSGIHADTLFAAAANGADSLLFIFITDLSNVECFPLSLEVPNVFTPNNDGILDLFYVRGTNIKSYKIEIYNRWGSLIFTETNIQHSWDGRINGNQAYAGQYYYIIIYSGLNGLVLSKKGSFSLIR